MFKVNKKETLSFHTHREPKSFRSWLHYRKFSASLEISTRRSGPSIKLHLGNKSSETPIDWHVGFIFVTFFGHLDWPGLGNFCHWIGRGHKRDLYLGIHNDMLWWKFWFDDDMGYDNHHKCDKRRKAWWWPFSWYREKHRSWMCLRDGSIDLNPLSAIWGRRYYGYETTAEKRVVLIIDDFPGDEYLVDLKLQECYRARTQGPSWVRWVSFDGLMVDWRCEKGIPTRNHDWKGDEVYASGVKLPEGDVDDWVETGKQLIINWAREERIRHNYRPTIKE